jgi:hypothetical protein
MAEAFDPFDPDEWGDKPECSAFETALDMRARGALSASAIQVLEAHLAACDSCREYEARSARVDARLGAVAGGPDWVRLREDFRKGLRRAHRVPIVMAGWIIGVLSLFAALSWLFTGQPPSWRSLTFSFVVTMLVIGCGVFIRIRRLRRMLTEPDPVAAQRRALEASLKTSRHFNRWLPVYLVITLLRVLSAAGKLAQGDRGGGAVLLMGILCFAGVIYAIILQRRRTRQIARELAEMH